MLGWGLSLMVLICFVTRFNLASFFSICSGVRLDLSKMCEITRIPFFLRKLGQLFKVVSWVCGCKRCKTLVIITKLYFLLVEKDERFILRTVILSPIPSFFAIMLRVLRYSSEISIDSTKKPFFAKKIVFLPQPAPRSSAFLLPGPPMRFKLFSTIGDGFIKILVDIIIPYC